VTVRSATDGVVMTATPTKVRMRLARRFGLDRNPLRRRSDVIAAWLAPVALLVFLALCPIVYVVSGVRVHADNTAVQHESQTWHRVWAKSEQAAPGPDQPDSGVNSWTVLIPVTWKADGRWRSGDYPVPAGSHAGQPVKVWIDQAGNLEQPPMNAAQVGNRVVADTMGVLGALAVLLAGLVMLIRRILDRRRLASWEIEWLTVGPRWSRHG
jgi:hypothetical protein